MDTNVTSEPILRLKGIYKSFPGVQALAGVDLAVNLGEVHAVMGENGAGKSTLIKIAAGVYAPTSGDIFFEGQPILMVNPRQATALGITVIHQEPYLFPTLSVLENLFLDIQPLTRRGLIDWKTMATRAQEMCQLMGIYLPLEMQVSGLSAAEQQLLQIARALLQQARVVIMDEPTSSLSQKEVATLFDIVRRLRERGVAVIYITHRLDEVFALADRVTVLRDGNFVGSYPVSQVTPQQLVALMVGRVISDLYPRTPTTPGEVVLRVSGLTRRGAFQNVTFEVRQGEIVSMAGLVGAGRSEVAQAIFGIEPADSGSVELDGEPLATHHPWDTMAAGVFYVPEDRHRQGIFAPLAVRSNLTMAILRRLARFGFVDRNADLRLADQYVQQLRIRVSSAEQPIGALSGGNQQKVVVARGLARQPRLLIMDEPTRGIDVGAKAEIHHLMNDLAHQHIGILMISSELPEVIGMSDRILVMRRGQLVGEVQRGEATQERVMSLAVGVNST
jgi:ABC-type sugar transport system ATPase subunit